MSNGITREWLAELARTAPEIETCVPYASRPVPAQTRLDAPAPRLLHGAIVPMTHEPPIAATAPTPYREASPPLLWTPRALGPLVHPVDATAVAAQAPRVSRRAVNASPARPEEPDA